MKKKWIIFSILLICVLLLILLAIIGPIMSRVEQPKYDVISVSSQQENIEIRQYPPILIAEVKVSGERKTAISKGFRLLADYIFGNNRVQEKISMTAPVQQQGESNSQKIAMTAPVQQQSLGEQWRVSFVMPSQYTQSTLPQPNNQQVIIKPLPMRQFIVIRFSGKNSDENISKHEAQLQQYIKKHGIKTIGAPVYAFYNPPWTLPFMRRNEIMIEIETNKSN